MIAVCALIRRALMGGLAATACLTMSAPAMAQTAPGVRGDYEFTGEIKLGAPAAQDYLTYHAPSGRLYVAHGPEVSVIDTKANKLVGTVGPFHDSHGIAIVDAAGKGYADDGEEGLVKVFSLSDLKVLKTIKVSEDADGMVFDAATGLVLVVAGDPHDLTTIDPATDTVRKRIALPGKPEFLAPDGTGKVFINMMELAQIVRVDILTGKVEAAWDLANCKQPKGLAYDPASHRLFSGCANGHLIVVDAANGRNVADLAIPPASDGIKFDPVRHIVFSSGLEGALSVISADGDDHYSVVRTIPTFFSGRTMAVDSETGSVFVAHGVVKRDIDPKNPRAVHIVLDGTNVATFKPHF